MIICLFYEDGNESNVINPHKQIFPFFFFKLNFVTSGLTETILKPMKNMLHRA